MKLSKCYLTFYRMSLFFATAALSCDGRILLQRVSFCRAAVRASQSHRILFYSKSAKE